MADAILRLKLLQVASVRKALTFTYFSSTLRNIVAPNKNN